MKLSNWGEKSKTNVIENFRKYKKLTKNCFVLVTNCKSPFLAKFSNFSRHADKTEDFSFKMLATTLSLHHSHVTQSRPNKVVIFGQIKKKKFGKA